MAFLASRTSRGKKYWSIVESRRINGKPRTVILEYLGSADSLLKRLEGSAELNLKSYCHGDTAALVLMAQQLGVVEIINEYVPSGPNGSKPLRDGLSVGASILLAAIGRACAPTSKAGWYAWCQTTSLHYTLGRRLNKLDSQHFWDQMHALPAESIPLIEEQLLARVVERFNLKPDCLLFDTTNFFTFIASTNDRCELPRRGRNKQKRYDLRQVGLALLVNREHQFPLFHKTYQGNHADVSVFSAIFAEMTERMRLLFKQVADVTLVFDKGNNSKDNFALLDQDPQLYYVASLVPSYFKELMDEANAQLQPVTLAEDEEVQAYHTQAEIWGQRRECVALISEQLREGQIRGIEQSLHKKLTALSDLQAQLQNPKSRKKWTRKQLHERVEQLIQGQYVNEILTYRLSRKRKQFHLEYEVDHQAYETLKEQRLGRRLLVTNRSDWSAAQIIRAYRAQVKVEYAFRNLKNPMHLAIRPQYHWTDQKLKVHFFMCVLGYLLTMAVYTQARQKMNYRRNVTHLLDELSSIRLCSMIKKKGRKISYELEQMSPATFRLAHVLGVTEQNIRSKINSSDYSL